MKRCAAGLTRLDLPPCCASPFWPCSPPRPPSPPAPSIPIGRWRAKSRARLVADARGAGFEIALAPGAITYWRDPGEAGVPPTFDFSGSANLAKAEVEYPAPERIAEPDGSTAFGYDASVILPIRVTPADPAKPVRLVGAGQLRGLREAVPAGQGDRRADARRQGRLALRRRSRGGARARAGQGRPRKPRRRRQRDIGEILAAMPDRGAGRPVRRGAGGLLGRAEAARRTGAATR